MTASGEIERLAEERALLVRFCAGYTRDPDAAEDLAQQTMLQAWRHEATLRDPAARRQWLLGIARNTCLAWGRGRSREQARFYGRDGAELEIAAHDVVDPIRELEREELLTLLDRALALLPPDTRAALIHRYVEDRPQAEIAARLGMTEGAVEARLQRGKSALRRLLAGDLSGDALALGLVQQAQLGWGETRLWCPGCGRRRLVGLFLPEKGRLDLHCPGCRPAPEGNYLNSHMGDEFRELHTVKPALSRVLRSIHAMFRVEGAGGRMPCPWCGGPALRRHAPDGSIRMTCAANCGWQDIETWHSLTWSLPEARQFWREHPRMRFLPPVDIEAGGEPAVLTGFENVAGTARLEVVSLRESLRVVSISGGEVRDVAV